MNRTQRKREEYYRGIEMPVRVKLEEPGQALTLTVASVLVEEVGGYDYYLIAGDGQEFLVPQKSIDGQLDRVGLEDAVELIGKTVKFSRSEKLNKFKKPYWNLDLAEAPKANGKPPAASSNVPNQQLPPLLQNQEAEDAAELQSKIGPPEKPKLTQLYLDATTFFLDRIVPKFEEEGIGLSDTAVVAGIATLFIAASKER